jgi:colanic acid/amylovoran biosynthesis glycosyltransferase
MKDKIKIAFVVGRFPVVSETFIIDQITGLEKRGVDVEILSFQRGEFENITRSFFDNKILEKTRYLDLPKGRFARIFFGVPRIISLAFKQPKILVKCLNFRKYGRDAYTLKLVYWAYWLKDIDVDLFHCHFGTVANKFMLAREVLGLRQKFVTTFYGFDASRIFVKHGPGVYGRLKEESSLFFVMSSNMKERLVKNGFDSRKIVIHPPGIDIESYPFKERELDGKEVRITSVGRFVEKKGFDDLIKALAIVKERSKTPFKCSLIGDGPMKEELVRLSDNSGVGDLVDFKGYMKIEDIIDFFGKTHFFVQPSKTAKDGNME